MCGGRTTGTVGTKDDLVSAGATCVDMHTFREGDIAWGPVVADGVKENLVNVKGGESNSERFRGESRQATGLTYIKRVTAHLGR